MTKYSKAMTERICKYIAEGKNMQETCRLCDIGTSTYNEWKHKHAAFSAAVKEAEAMRLNYLGELSVASIAELIQGFESEEVTTYEHDENGKVTEKIVKKRLAPDSRSTFLMLKNAFPELIKDKKETEVSGELKTINIEIVK